MQILSALWETIQSLWTIHCYNYKSYMSIKFVTLTQRARVPNGIELDRFVYRGFDKAGDTRNKFKEKYTLARQVWVYLWMRSIKRECGSGGGGARGGRPDASELDPVTRCTISVRFESKDGSLPPLLCLGSPYSFLLQIPLFGVDRLTTS